LQRLLNTAAEENLTKPKIPENPPEKEVSEKMREVDLTTNTSGVNIKDISEATKDFQFINCNVNITFNINK
jgi:hypothetical protein